MFLIISRKNFFYEQTQAKANSSGMGGNSCRTFEGQVDRAKPNSD